MNTTLILKYVYSFFKIKHEMVNTFSVNVLIYLNAVQYSASNAEFGYESEWENAGINFVNLVILIKKNLYIIFKFRYQLALFTRQ